MHIFEAGLHGQPSSAPPSGNLDALLRQKMQLSIEMEAMSPDPAMPLQGQDPSSALNGVGDYLVRTASMWSRFTENLAVGDHVERAVGEAHIRAAHDTRFSDMSDIAALDIDLNKLR